MKKADNLHLSSAPLMDARTLRVAREHQTTGRKKNTFIKCQEVEFGGCLDGLEAQDTVYKDCEQKLCSTPSPNRG